ncbi:MAG: hypothetical protein H6Q41_4601, partial [Deltaproteobacteria bacterium]|nr:hypothetical protein [Deltaproteobacteria bacterium]
KKGEALEDHGSASRIGRQIIDPFAGQKYVPLIRFDEPREHAQSSRLSTATGSQHAKVLPFGDFNGKSIHSDFFAEPLRQGNQYNIKIVQDGSSPLSFL